MEYSISNIELIQYKIFPSHNVAIQSRRGARPFQIIFRCGVPLLRKTKVGMINRRTFEMWHAQLTCTVRSSARSGAGQFFLGRRSSRRKMEQVFPSRRRFSRDSSSRAAVSLRPPLRGSASIASAADFRALIFGELYSEWARLIEMCPDITNKLFKTTSLAEPQWIIL